MQKIFGFLLIAVLAACSALDRDVSLSPLTSTRSIAVGNQHTCAVLSGTVKCWGENTLGQLGNGTTTDSVTPIKPYVLPARAYGVATGGSHSCVLLAVSAGTNPSLRCWGDNSQGQLGSGNTTASIYPLDITLALAPVAIVAGVEYTCAVGGEAAGIKCWGRNDTGQVGNGGAAQVVSPSTVLAGTTVLSLGVGASHTCAVVSTGLKCWGLNSSYQLGADLPPPVPPTNRTIPTNVLGHVAGSGVVLVETGNDHSCAVIQGKLKCWGSNMVGQLGDGTNTDRAIPTEVTGLPAGVSIVSLGLGNRTSFALLSDDSLYAWGLNTTGQLGLNSTTDQATPMKVSGAPSGIQSIAASINGHSCVATSSGFFCWGQNTKGQLGNGNATQSLTPVSVLF